LPSREQMWGDQSRYGLVRDSSKEEDDGTVPQSLGEGLVTKLMRPFATGGPESAEQSQAALDEEGGLRKLWKSWTTSKEQAEAEAKAKAAKSAAGPAAPEDTMKLPPGVLATKATPPVDLCFICPQDAEPGQLVIVQGPHGKLRVPIPEGVRPREKVTTPLYPLPETEKITVDVPEHVVTGDVVSFKTKLGELQVAVPPGKGPGDTFEVWQPVLLVRVPKGAKSGDSVGFMAPDGRQLITVIPDAPLTTGQYFPTHLAPQEAVAEKVGSQSEN